MRLKEIRQQRGLSQAELARRAHVHRVSINRYESGAIKPNIETLVKLSHALNVTPGELLGESA